MWFLKELLAYVTHVLANLMMKTQFMHGWPKTIDIKSIHTWLPNTISRVLFQSWGDIPRQYTEAFIQIT